LWCDYSSSLLNQSIRTDSKTCIASGREEGEGGGEGGGGGGGRKGRGGGASRRGKWTQENRSTMPSTFSCSSTELSTHVGELLHWPVNNTTCHPNMCIHSYRHEICTNHLGFSQYLPLLLQLADHYNSADSVLPDHLPEVVHCMFQRTLCQNVPMALLVTLWEGEVGGRSEGGERRRTCTGREVFGQRRGKEEGKCGLNLHRRSWHSCSQTR